MHCSNFITSADIHWHAASCRHASFSTVCGIHKDMTNNSRPRILLIGTGDTKADELLFMQRCINLAGGETVMMDISVLGDPPYEAQHDKHAVAAAAGTTLEAVIASCDENSSMTLMARGASRLTRQLCE